MNAFTIPAQFQRFASRSDGSYTLTFSTMRETSPETVAVLSIALNTEGYIAYKPGEFSDLEISAMPERKIERSDRTPSQRLRAVLAVLAQQQALDIDTVYALEMSRIIDHYKNKLSRED